MKIRGWLILAGVVAVVWIASGHSLGKFLPNFHLNIAGIDLNHQLFTKKAGPVKVKVGKVRIVGLSPSGLTPDAYVKGQVSEIEASQKIDRSFDFDSHPRLTLKKGQFIAVDTLIGYDSSKNKPFFRVIPGKNQLNATLVINPDAFMAIQPRAVPYLNQDKMNCDDDRLSRPALESGSCGDLAVGLLDASVAAFQVGCLKKAWPVIKSQIVIAELYRNQLMLNYMKRLYPQYTWKKIHIKVVFSPNKPALTKLPAGFFWADKHDKVWNKGAGDIFLVKKIVKGNKTSKFRIDLNHLQCTPKKELLKKVRQNLLTAARTAPATPTE